MYDHALHFWEITRADITPQVKRAINLGIPDGHTLIFLSDLCEYVWVKKLTLSPQG